MARAKTRHVCASCGHEALSWTGRCPGCGEWNTLEERAGASTERRRGGVAPSPTSAPRPLREVEAHRAGRLTTRIGELDRVLGGGLVPGSLVLLGGAPGIGKSTLTGMALGNLANAGRRVLYVTAEESPAQVRLRAERLGGAALDVPVVAETELERVLALLDAERPEACVVDSIQTVAAHDSSSAPGSPAQVREVAGRIMEEAKRTGTAVLLVGHVTKDGAVAGPRVLEHLVDCVLLFEGDAGRSIRMLRALKNRFGATHELGVFAMRAGGLEEVDNPSALLTRSGAPAPGSVVLATMEGSRPLLVEIQALVAPTDVEPPRRVANGIDRNRLAMVLAVLTRHAGVSGLGGCDVFLNAAGGVRVDDPGADLAVALAVASAKRGVALVSDGHPVACFGEVGLTGELRPVASAERRAGEASRMGMPRVLAPSAGQGQGPIVALSSLEDALASAGLGGLRDAASPRAA